MVLTRSFESKRLNFFSWKVCDKKKKMGLNLSLAFLHIITDSRGNAEAGRIMQEKMIWWVTFNVYILWPAQRWVILAMKGIKGNLLLVYNCYFTKPDITMWNAALWLPARRNVGKSSQENPSDRNPGSRRPPVGVQGSSGRLVTKQQTQPTCEGSFITILSACISHAHLHTLQGHTCALVHQHWE